MRNLTLVLCQAGLLAVLGGCSVGYSHPATYPTPYEQPQYQATYPTPYQQSSQTVYAPAPYYQAPVYYTAYAPPPPSGYMSVSILLNGRRGWQHVPHGHGYYDGRRHHPGRH